MYRRRGLTDQEILLELEGDYSGNEFSDSDGDEYDEVVSAARAQVEEFVSGVDESEDLLRQIAEAGSYLKLTFKFANFIILTIFFVTEGIAIRNLAVQRDEEEPEDAEPSPSYAVPRREINWRKVNIGNIDAECSVDPVDVDEFADWTPLQYFRHFIDDDIISHIAAQTNLFAAQKDINTSFRTNETEIRVFLDITS